MYPSPLLWRSALAFLRTAPALILAGCGTTVVLTGGGGAGGSTTSASTTSVSSGTSVTTTPPSGCTSGPACQMFFDCPGSPTSCTVSTCMAGCCAAMNVPAGTDCAGAGGKICDGLGDCVGCLSAGDCPGTGTACAFATCDVTSHTCATIDAPAGTPCSDSGGVICNGAGACTSFSTCADMIQDGAETDIDCGGPVCPKCAAGKKCASAADCVTGHCQSGVCM